MTANSADHPHEPPADVDYPSRLRLTARPFEDAREEALENIERWEQGEDVPHTVNFQDASRLQRILTPRRLELIRSLLEERAESIRSLADRLDRDVRQVHDDLQLLAEYRIVHFAEQDGAKQPFVPYETISIEVELSVAESEDESTAAP